MKYPNGEKMEQDLLDRGIQPATMNWPERSRIWFYDHGGSLDPLTGDCIYGPKIQLAARDYKRPYKQQPREHSSRIERGTS